MYTFELQNVGAVVKRTFTSINLIVGVKMKISKVLYGIMCAGILCSSVAQASIIAESKVEVENLALTFFDAAVGGTQLVVGSDVILSDVDISFTGTSVSTTLNGVNDADSYSGSVLSVYDPILVDISSMQYSGADLATAESKLSGNLLTTGASGKTDSNVKVYGMSKGDANSQIVNNLETTFSFTVGSDVYIDLSFDWVLDAYVSVFDEGGEGVATWDLSVSLSQDSASIGAAPLIGFDLSDTVGDQSGTLNDVGDIFDNKIESSFVSGRQLLAAGAYVLNINQNTSAAAISVSAPASLAILSLGLLGIAGFSRRNIK
jgi:hypothetical protein